MANIFRRIQVIFDRASAEKAEQELESSMAEGGKKAGEAFVGELHGAFSKRMADLRVQLAKGLIDPKQFKQQGDLAKKQFNAGIISGMEAARKAGNLTDKEFIKLSRTLKRVGDEGISVGARIRNAFLKLGSTIAAIFSVRAVLGFFRESINEALEAEETVTRLRAALEPLGIAYDNVSKEVEGYFDTIQKTTRFSDEDAREAFSRLVSATGDYDKSLRLLNLTAQIAEKRQTTMAEASDVAIKASLGLTRGMQDLGVQIGATGDVTEVVARNLGHMAEAAASSDTRAKIQQAVNLWGEFKEQLGAAIIGADGVTRAGKDLRTSLVDLNEWVTKNKDSISDWSSQTVESIRDIVNAINFARKVLQFPANVVVSGAELLGIPTDRTKEETKKTVKGVQDIVVTAHAVRRKLSEDEQRILLELVEDGGKSIEDLTRAQIEQLYALEKDAVDGRIVLTKEQFQAIERLHKEEATRRKQAIREAQREAKRLAKQFKDNKADIEQEVADLQRLAAAHGQGARAVGALTSVLRGEADARKAAKDLSAGQAKELTNLIRIREQERQTVEFLSQSLDLDQEIADLKRLAEVQDQGVEAVEAMEHNLQLEAEIRRAVIGLTDDQAAAIENKIRLSDKEQRGIDAQGRIRDIQQEIADTKRLTEVQSQGTAAIEETQRQLERESEIRRAVAGLVGEHATAVADVIRELQRERKALSETTTLNELARQVGIAKQVAEAEHKGEAAVRALNRELFIQEELLRAGAKAGTEFAAKVRALAGAQFDAANKVQGKWVAALDVIREEMTTGIGQAFVSRNDDKERIDEIKRALQQENLTVKERIKLEKELANLKTPWLIKLAAAKVKENLAAAIEMAAKALGLLAFGNPAQAALAAKAAAGHTAAAAAWKLIAGAGGGGGGGGGGSVGSSSAASASNLERPESAINIYLTGPGWNALNPEVQKVTYQAMEYAKERYGSNSQVRIIRGSR